MWGLHFLFETFIIDRQEDLPGASRLCWEIEVFWEAAHLFGKSLAIQDGRAGVHPELRVLHPELHFSSVIEGDSWKRAVRII